MFRTYQRGFWRGDRPGGRASALSGRLVVAALALLVLVLGLWREPILALS
jgi:hypothetical protein